MISLKQSATGSKMLIFPVSLLENEVFSPQTSEGLTLVNLEINDGYINRITSTIPPKIIFPSSTSKKSLFFLVLSICTPISIKVIVGSVVLTMMALLTVP
jgi:hypothetical protein